MEFDENLLASSATDKQTNQGETNNLDLEIKRFKKEIELRDNQIETLKKANEGKKDSAILQQKIAELTNYNEDLKKFQLDKDFQINELNKILQNKEKEIANLKEKNRNENQADAELKAENERLQKEIQRLNGRLNDLEIKMYKANDDRSILEKLNKEFAEKINDFQADLDEKIKIKEDELIELRDKITDFEAIIEEKDEAIKILEEQLIGNEDLIVKLKDENKNLIENKREERKEKEDIEEQKNEEENENKEEKVEDEDKTNKMDVEDYILKGIHEEMLEEKQNEINTLINTVNVVKRDREDLEVKIANMKSSVQGITQRLEVEMDNHSNNNEEKAEMIQREVKLTESLHAAEDKINKMKIIIKTLSKEKNDMEELILKQENKVSDLAAKIKIVDKNIKEKNKELAENDENSMKLINIIEDQKKQIENLSRNQANVPSNKIVLSTRDEMQLKKIITEKDNEITTLKVYNDNLKNDVHVKDQNIAAMQKTLSRYQEEIKRLKLSKIDQVKEKQNSDNLKDKENETKNAVVSAKLWNKKIKIEAKDTNKEDPNTIENLIKNKLNNKKNLLERNIENYNTDVKLPDIHKNQKNLGVNKKITTNSNNNININIDNRYETDDFKLNYREKDNEAKATYSGNKYRKQYSHKKENKEEYKNNDLINYNENYEGNNINEKKIRSSKKAHKKEEDKKDVDLDSSSNIQNLEAENDNNINDISNMMKNILSDEHQII